MHGVTMKFNADLCLRSARLPIVLTVSYAFPKAFQVSPDVAEPPYVTSRLFPFRPFPSLSAFVKHEMFLYVLSNKSYNNNRIPRLEFLTAVLLRMPVFWNVQLRL